MQRKFIHIFTITLLSLCLVEAQSFAQEGEELPIKPETDVLAKDSVSSEETVVEEPKVDMLTPVVITPKNQNILKPEDENSSPKTNKSNAPVGEKAKEGDENSPNLRFNLLYYLFYKVKVGSSSSTSS